MGWRPALIAGALLLFDHFIEARLLFGRENRPKLVSCALKLFANPRIHGLHHFLNSFLAGAYQLVRLLTLLRRQIEFAFRFF